MVCHDYDQSAFNVKSFREIKSILSDYNRDTPHGIPRLTWTIEAVRLTNTD